MANPYSRKSDGFQEQCMLCEGIIFTGEQYWEYPGQTGYQADDLVVCSRCKDMLKFCKDCGSPFIPDDENGELCEDCWDLYATSGEGVNGRIESIPLANQPPLPRETICSKYTSEPGHPDNEYVEFRKGNVVKRVWVGPHPSDNQVSEGLKTAVAQAATVTEPAAVLDDGDVETSDEAPATVVTGDNAKVTTDSAAVEITTGDTETPQKVKKVKCRKHNGNGKTKKTYSSDLSEYRVKECGFCGDKDKDKPLVSISVEVWTRALKLMRAVDTEWLGYLMGRKLPNGNYEITEIVIPTQEVGYGDCENKEAPPPDSIGIIHSHHTMFASHSSIDDNGIDQQNGVSIVISTQGCTVTVKRDLPCGMFIVLEANYEVVMPDADVADWIAQSRGKLNRKNYQSSPQSTVGVMNQYPLDQYGAMGPPLDQYGAVGEYPWPRGPHCHD
jgi:hypothetical protein